jgi:hypothetical protein
MPEINIFSKHNAQEKKEKNEKQLPLRSTTTTYFPVSPLYFPIHTVSQHAERVEQAAALERYHQFHRHPKGRPARARVYNGYAQCDVSKQFAMFFFFFFSLGLRKILRTYGGGAPYYMATARLPSQTYRPPKSIVRSVKVTFPLFVPFEVC